MLWLCVWLRSYEQEKRVFVRQTRSAAASPEVILQQSYRLVLHRHILSIHPYTAISSEDVWACELHDARFKLNQAQWKALIKSHRDTGECSKKAPQGRRVCVWRIRSGHTDSSWMDRNVTDSSVCLASADTAHALLIHNAATWTAIKKEICHSAGAGLWIDDDNPVGFKKSSLGKLFWSVKVDADDCIMSSCSAWTLFIEKQTWEINGQTAQPYMYRNHSSG